MITLEKARQIALEYQKTGFLNKEQTLVNCGYSPKYARSGVSRKLFANTRVKEQIDLLQAEKKEELKLTRQSQLNKIIDLRNKAEQANHYSAANTANDQINKYLGLYEEDNLQKVEDQELKELQKQDLEDYKAYKRRQMMKVGA